MFVYLQRFRINIFSLYQLVYSKNRISLFQTIIVNRMSVTYTEVKDKEILRKAEFYGMKGYVIAEIDSKAIKKFPFFDNFELSPCFLSKKYVRLSDRIFNFKVRPDDVWVTSFVKAGSTWLSNIVWQLQHNLDFTASYVSAAYNVVESAMFFDNNDENTNDHDYHEYQKGVDNQLDNLDKEPSPRLIKTHLPAHFLPTDVWTVKPKLIYVYRNVKDVAVSMFHMFRKHIFLAYKGSMEDCFDSFLSDNVIYGPFHSHVKSYRQLSMRLDNILILTYEGLLTNPFTEIKRISEFLNFTYSDEQLNQLVEHVSFAKMHASKMNLRFTDGFNFYRKGKANGYRDEMSAEYIQKFEEWERKHSTESN